MFRSISERMCVWLFIKPFIMVWSISISINVQVIKSMLVVLDYTTKPGLRCVSDGEYICSYLTSSCVLSSGLWTFSGPRSTTPYPREQRSPAPHSRSPASASHTTGRTCARPRTTSAVLLTTTPCWCTVSNSSDTWTIIYKTIFTSAWKVSRSICYFHFHPQLTGLNNWVCHRSFAVFLCFDYVFCEI